MGLRHDSLVFDLMVVSGQPLPRPERFDWSAMNPCYPWMQEIGRQPVDAAVCMACHLIQGEGGNIGPNLSGVGAMGIEAILRNILTPNAAMESAYHTFRVEMKDGSIRDGFLAGEDDLALILRTPGAEDQRIEKSLVRDSKFLRSSLMPEGLLDHYTDEQTTDLLEFLETLK